MKSLTSIFACSALTLALCIQPAADAAAQNANDGLEEDFPIVDVATSEAASRLAELEKAFWICDYAATTYGVDMVDFEACSTVTEGLKRVKFGGDFDVLVDWWSEHKAAEHGALELASFAHANAARNSTEIFPDPI